MDIQFIVGILTIIGSMYGMLKFMLKDVHKEVEILKDGQEQFKQELREFNQELKLTHRRLDGLYQILLDRTYGANIPSSMK